MKKYRKKPVVIEAVQLDITNLPKVMEWCSGQYYSQPPMRTISGITIQTLEGQMIGQFGDWIIKGIMGEFYPCKDDIFQATYEPVED